MFSKTWNILMSFNQQISNCRMTDFLEFEAISFFQAQTVTVGQSVFPAPFLPLNPNRPERPIQEQMLHVCLINPKANV